MTAIVFATLVAIIVLLFLCGAPAWATVTLSVFGAVMALIYYMQRRVKYAFCNTLVFAAVSCFGLAGIGISISVTYDDGKGLASEAKYGTTTIENLALLAAGVVLTIEATFVWARIYQADQIEQCAQRQALEWRETARTGKRTSQFPLRNWIRNRQLRKRLNQIALDWAPLSRRPKTLFLRPEVEAIHSVVDNQANKVICVLGAKGSGKTTLMLQFVEQCRVNKLAVLPIKADLASRDDMLESWIAHKLETKNNPVDELKRFAKRQRLIIIIDQLDALASLVDLTSSRLNDVLTFVKQLTKTKNISIVCTCRSFDFHRDVRFQSMKAATVELALPPWEDVKSVLSEQGVQQTEQFPATFQEVLRNPQHLQIYLRQFRAGHSSSSYQTYYDMLDQVWREVVNSDSRRKFTYDLTNLCIDRESVTVPYVLLESAQEMIAELEAEEIIAQNGKQIGFVHQTLLEYAKARLFIKTDESLCSHVLQRQTAVHIRPTLWAVLTYLRDVSPDKYHKELDDFFRSDLRLHVRYLLIDFLGQVPDLTQKEIEHMTSRLQVDDDRGRVLIAIRGNKAWFEALEPTHLAAQMTLPVLESWPMVGVLSQAWSFSRSDCLRLIKQNWLSDPEKDEWTRRAMAELVTWDEEAANVVCQLIRRADADSERLWWAEQFVNVIANDKPELAPRVFLEAARKVSENREPKSGRDRLLTDKQSWYGLPDVAAAVPSTFLETVWPWFVEKAEEYHSGQLSSVLNYYGSGHGSLDPSDTRLHLVQAVAIALTQSAKDEPTKFEEITRPTWASESRPVHRLLAAALIDSVDVNSAIAMDYLRGDMRRFFLGDYKHGELIDSCKLVTALATQFDQKKINELQNLIVQATRYRPGVELSEEQLAWEREDRQALLKSLPVDAINDEIRQRFELDAVHPPKFGHARSFGRSGSIREIPKLSKEELSTASDQEILDAVVGPLVYDSDEVRWIEEEEAFERPGGVLAQSRAIGDFVKEEHTRIVQLLPQMLLQGSELTVAEVLSALAESGLTSREVFKLILNLAQLGANSEHFRSSAGCLLYKHSQKGLPAAILDLINEWLLGPWPSEKEDAESRPLDIGTENGESPESILWGCRRGVTIYTRCYWLLRAATNGYIAVAPAKTKPWLELVEKLIDSDLNDETWQIYCQDLTWIKLKGCDHAFAESVISRLFDRKPNLARSDDAVMFVAKTAHVLSTDFVRNYVHQLSSPNAPHPNAYGELLTYLALCGQPHAWAVSELDSLLVAIETSPAQMESAAVGVAFAAAHMWVEPKARDECCRILSHLMPVATDRVATAIGQLFYMQDNLTAESTSKRLLAAISDNPQVLSGSYVEELIDHLVPLAEHFRPEVLKLCRLVVVRYGPELLSIQYSLYMAGPHLVNIAMTLQRYNETRESALDLLEELLRIGLDDAYAVLNENDMRPGLQPREAFSRRRRRMA